MSFSKKNIVQINVESNFGSTGKICENLSEVLLKSDNTPYVGHGPIHRASNSNTLAVGSKWDYYLHILNTRIFDKHGLGSKSATKVFLDEVAALKPDLLHLHNIHGYFINYELLFEFIKTTDIPVVWTLHDCWAFTGHCTHFEYIGCEKWKSECHTCPLTHTYPKSWYYDRSLKNFKQKKNAFSGVKNMTLVPVSDWLGTKVKDSFLQHYPTQTISNGIDVDEFKPTLPTGDTILEWYKNFSIILGVASVWDKTKGWEDFIKMASLLKHDERIILVGLSETQLKQLPKNIIGLRRTESKQELIQLYSIAKVFMNLTYADTYPTTNLESLACGTPVITYNTGGSPQEIKEFNGRVVALGAYKEAYLAFSKMKEDFKEKNTATIRTDAVNRLDKSFQLKTYTELYQSLLIERLP